MKKTDHRASRCAAALLILAALMLAISGCTDDPAPEVHPAAKRSPTAEPFYVYYDRDNTDAVTELQHRLRELGYYGGEITGRYDDETAEAVMLFQLFADLDPSGVADDETLDALFKK